jgi:RHH-type proline utilization regulon transcriptional repressor/proline dehydrogenase/delta 1-pyrroline-5-carboxylate dehydrogenase
LLPYLVRRLLENGANTSFVNRITDENVPIRRSGRRPGRAVAGFDSKSHPRIPPPIVCSASNGRIPWAPTSPTKTN